MAGTLKLLIVSDADEDAGQIAGLLSLGGFEISHRRIESHQEMKEALHKQQWDAIVCKYAMPLFDAPAALRLHRDSGIDIPFITITEDSGQDKAVAMIKAGAHDCLPRQRLGDLATSLKLELKAAWERRQIKRTDREKNDLIAELEKSELRYRQIFNNVGNAVLIHDFSGRILEANHVACESLQYPKETLLKMNLRQIEQQENGASRIEEIQRAGRTSYETTHRTKDGRLLPVEVSSRIIYYEGKAVILCSSRNIARLRYAEEALSDAEERYRLIAGNTTDVVWLIDLETMRYTYFSPSVEAARGFTVAEAMATPIDKAITPFTLRHLLEVIHDELGKEGQPGIDPDRRRLIELEEYCRSGTTIRTEAKITLHRDKTGRPRSALVVTRDITTRKKAEEQIRLNEARLESLLRISQYSAKTLQELLDFALDEAVKLTSSRVGYIFQYDPAKKTFTQVTWSRDVAKECSGMAEQKYTQLEKTGIWGEAVRQGRPIVVNEFQAPHALKRGYPSRHPKLLKYLTIPVFNEDRIAAVVGVANKEADYNIADVRQLTLLMDSVWKIVERKRADDELRKYREHLEELVQERTSQLTKLTRAVEESPLSVVITDKTGRLEYVNPKFTEVTGYSYEEVLNQNPRILKSGVHPPEYYESMWKTITSGREWHNEICNKKKNGELYWESSSIAPIKNEEGEITHFVAVKEDITEKKRIAEELHKAKEAAEKASRAKGTFLTNMSHEIRTPMNAILGFSQLLMRDQSLNDTQKQHLNAINRSGEHLLALIEDILEMSKIEAGRTTLNPATFDLHSMLDDIAMMFKVRTDEKMIRFVLEKSEGLPRFVVADSKKLRQVLINLLGNAVKFTENGGITLRGSFLRSQDAGLRFLCEVEDTGPGISAEEAGNLFKYFEQTQSGRRAGTGTGLGLAISREFVRLMGGDITLQSEVGKGSVFRFDIPVMEGKGDEVPRKVEVPVMTTLKPGQEKRNILIVDDSDDNRKLLVRILEGSGFRTMQASNGREAVEVFSKLHPDLILMDIRMPVMDGYEATHEIREKPGGGSVKIVFVTASAFDRTRQQAMVYGADDFVGKPFRVPELLDKIRFHLDLEYNQAPKGSTPAKQADATGAAGGPAPDFAGRLPPDVVVRLREATAKADYDAILEEIGRLYSVDTQAAQAFQSLIERFEYQKLLDLLKQ
jgi:PAS domain S-box-containing protein